MRLLVLALAAVLCSAGTASASPLGARPCPRHAELTSRAATLTVRIDDDGYHALTACVRATRKRIVLAAWYAQGSVADDPAPQYWLTGRFVAVNQPSCTPDPFDDVPCTATLRVVDLRTRERRSTVQLADPVSDLVLTRHGSVAMIHRTDLITADGPTVSYLDGAAERGSLAYAARAARIYWTSGGEPRSAPLR